MKVLDKLIAVSTDDISSKFGYQNMQEFQQILDSAIDMSRVLGYTVEVQETTNSATYGRFIGLGFYKNEDVKFILDFESFSRYAILSYITLYRYKNGIDKWVTDSKEGKRIIDKLVELL